MRVERLEDPASDGRRDVRAGLQQRGAVVQKRDAIVAVTDSGVDIESGRPRRCCTEGRVVAQCRLAGCEGAVGEARRGGDTRVKAGQPRQRTLAQREVLPGIGHGRVEVGERIELGAGCAGDGEQPGARQRDERQSRRPARRG